VQNQPPQDNRIDRRLTRTATGGALLPYLTGGYPDLDATVEWIKHLDTGGIAAVEIGFPYSDSIADGPVIQDSFNRALLGGLKIDRLFDAVAAVRPEVETALIAMVSFSIVRRIGVQTFMGRAGESGFDGLIVPDISYEESDEVSDAAAAQGLHHVMLVAATTPPQRAAKIARRSTGFVYQVAVRGITGERNKMPDDLRARVRQLRAAANKPVCVGFGISNAAHVRQVCQVADGVIVGSAIVRRITEAIDAGKPRATIVETIARFIDELADGTRQPES